MHQPGNVKLLLLVYYFYIWMMVNHATSCLTPQPSELGFIGLMDLHNLMRYIRKGGKGLTTDYLWLSLIYFLLNIRDLFLCSWAFRRVNSIIDILKHLWYFRITQIPQILYAGRWVCLTVSFISCLLHQGRIQKSIIVFPSPIATILQHHYNTI